MVDGNGEFVFICSVCQHFLKLVPVATKEELVAALTEHEAINRPVAEATQKEKEFQERLKKFLEE